MNTLCVVNLDDLLTLFFLTLSLACWAVDDRNGLPVCAGIYFVF